MINATMIQKQQTKKRVAKALKGYVRRQNKRENILRRFWVLLRDSRDLEISRTDAWRVIRQQCQEGA